MLSTKLRNSKDIDRYLETIDEKLAPIARAVRATIRKSAPKLTETMKWGQPCWVGRSNVCYIAAYSQHVNLGFYRGAELTDVTGRLEGTGKGLRHVKVHSVSEARAKPVAALITAAARLDER